VSSNWAGYAVSGKSVRFRRVSASWTVPTGTCAAGERSDSVVWVGLGGLSTSSQALEQTGTQLTCTGSGQARYSAWYELVPAGSHTLRVTILPGNRIAASVTVRGKDVRISLRNLTRGSGVAFTRHMSAPDTASDRPPFVGESSTGALPSSLTASGSAFSVSYGQAATSEAATSRPLGATRR
jgi:hypothetical protein